MTAWRHRIEQSAPVRQEAYDKEEDDEEAKEYQADSNGGEEAKEDWASGCGSAMITSNDFFRSRSFRR